MCETLFSKFKVKVEVSTVMLFNVRTDPGLGLRILGVPQTRVT